MKSKTDVCNVAVFYGTYTSVYKMKKIDLHRIQFMMSGEKIDDYIIVNGKFVGHEDEGHQFDIKFDLDVTEECVRKFHLQVEKFLRQMR